MNSSPPTVVDAIDWLTADHRRVQQCFSEFQANNTLLGEHVLAQQICKAIRVHAEIDEKIFYPAFLEATHEQYKHQEAMREHAAMRELIEEIEHAGPTEDIFFAKLHVLCEMFSQHVKQEEKVRGIFFVAQQSALDLKALGNSIQAHKSQE